MDDGVLSALVIGLLTMIALSHCAQTCALGELERHVRRLADSAEVRR